MPEVNPTFYDVPPTVGPSHPTLVPPKVSSTVTAELPPTHSSRFPMRSRLILIIVALVIIIGGAAAFAYSQKWFRFPGLSRNNAPVSNDTTQDLSTPAATASTDTASVTTSAEWQQRYFNAEQCLNPNICGDNADPDRDGLANLDEFNAQTDPNNPDSDTDGLADGDEVKVFGSDPTKSKTNPDSGNYTDLDFIRGGYDVQTNNLFTPNRLAEITAKMKELGLNQPTISSVGPVALNRFGFNDPTQPQPVPTTINVEQTPEAKLERDTERMQTIKKIGRGLVAFQVDKKSFPNTQDFVQMTEQVKPYITVATRFNDPINLDRYVYGYQSLDTGRSFILTYYSETQNQLIKYRSEDAAADALKDDSKQLDTQRTTDLENLRTALLIYSSANNSDTGTLKYVFPAKNNLATSLVPQYLSAIPKDPGTGQAYDYQPGDKFDTFTIKTRFDAPAAGTTGYLCNQEECQAY